MDNNKTEDLPEPKNEIVVYQPDETIRLAVRLENETVWLTQSQLCELFQRDVSVISRHIKNIFSEGELDKESNLHYLQIATSDRPVALYSLDVIISVGYRAIVGRAGAGAETDPHRKGDPFFSRASALLPGC